LIDQHETKKNRFDSVDVDPSNICQIITKYLSLSRFFFLRLFVNS